MPEIGTRSSRFALRLRKLSTAMLPLLPHNNKQRISELPLCPHSILWIAILIVWGEAGASRSIYTLIKSLTEYQ